MDPSSPIKLEQLFAEKVQEETLNSLLPVIQGLMKFRPSDRMSALQALDLVASQIDGMETDEEDFESNEMDDKSCE